MPSRTPDGEASLVDQLRPHFTADEWPRVAPAFQRIQRNRRVKREVKQRRRRGRTVRQACMDVASGHGLSPNTVEAIFYGRR